MPTKANITGYINNKRVSVLDISVQYQIDTYANVGFTIPADEIELRSVRNEDYSIYVDDELFISGIVLNRPSFQIKNGKHTYKIKATGQMGRLSCVRSKSSAHYQDSLIVAILTDLLSYTDEFVLDVTNYLGALTDVTTIELGSKESLWAQIVEVIKSVPNLHIRYGGIDNNDKHVLEIGEFGKTLYTLQDGINLVSLSVEPDSQRVYDTVEAFGGASPANRITLSSAVDDGRALVHPDYADFPIVFDGVTGTYYVENQNISGCQITKKFDLQKTDRAEQPTVAQLGEAGYALWLKTVRFMQQHTSSEIYQGSYLSKRPMTLGDKAFVVARVTEDSYNDLTGQMEKITLFEVMEEFKIVAFATKLESYSSLQGDSIDEAEYTYLWDFEATTGDDINLVDPELELYERLEKPDDTPSPEAIGITPSALVSDEHFGAEASDCSGSGIAAGKIFTFTPIGQPSGVTSKTWTVISTLPDGDELWNIVTSDDSDPFGDVELCVAPSGGNWGTLGAGDSIKVNLIFFYV